MPFTNFNRMHVVPPCNITEAEAKEGIAIIDEALANIAKYYEGKIDLEYKANYAFH